MERYSHVLLRYGLVFVFIWFGVSQISDQRMWVSYVPDWAVMISGLSAPTIVYINGMLEILLAIMLAVGVYVRFASGILFLHMLGIIWTIGLTAIGVRDLGLAFALLSIFLHGPDHHCYDHEPESA